MRHFIGFIALAAALAQPPAGKKVYISVDMEGISGVASDAVHQPNCADCSPYCAATRGKLK